MKPIQIKVILGVFLGLIAQSCVSSFPDLDTRTTIQEDINTIIICDGGLRSLLDYSKEKAEPWGLSSGNESIALERAEKESLVSTWRSLLDYLAQLDHIQQKHSQALLLDKKESDNYAMYCYYLAFLTQYQTALEFLNLMENNENIHVYLNEAYPQYGLEENLYRQFKYHFLNVFLATKFVALDAIMSETKAPKNFEHLVRIESAEEYLYDMGMGSGTTMTFENGVKMMQDAAFEFWLPLQKSVSTFMGGKKLWRVDQSLMTSKEVQLVQSSLEPGDIIFTRKEWALTNLGLPGFWTHTALYISTPKHRQVYFSDEETKTWVRGQGISSGDFEILLENKYGSTYEQSKIEPEDGTPFRVIEALAPGVILNSLETTLTCDGVAALRPKLSKLDKAKAISYAFSTLGKPYDLNFDFRTDSAMVCSELIIKAYEPTEGGEGLNIQTTQIGQRIVTPCNTIIQQFSEEYGTADQQLEYVLFYDGYEKQNRAIKSDVDQLLESWKRPDWHIFLQE